MLDSLIEFLKFAKDRKKEFKEIWLEILSTYDKGKLTIDYNALRTRYRLHPKTQQRIIKEGIDFLTTQENVLVTLNKAGPKTTQEIYFTIIPAEKLKAIISKKGIQK